jgi:uncharacterized surface protein with fasciclin (FAS1) repeats
MANLVEVAQQSGSFNTLIKAVEAAGLTEILAADERYTLLAPTDDAFDQLPKNTLDALLQDLPQLKRVVLYHVLFGDVRSDDLAQIDEAPTMEGSIVAIDHAQGVQVNDATVTQMDILADNGVIHAIDAVLVPALLGELE